MKVLMVLGAFICIPIAQLDMKKDLVNEFYGFEGNEDAFETVQLQEINNIKNPKKKDSVLIKIDSK